MSHVIKTFPRRDVLRAALAAGAALVLPAAPAGACEFFCPTLRITHPWTRASAPGATTAVVSMRFDEVTENDRLIRVETPVAAGAELVAEGADGPARPVNLSIAAGQVLNFSETGIHIRLTGLRQPLEIARSYPLTLTFEKGGVVEADLSVDYL
ncbi:MAG: copper chaperone PCu(A)C [Microbacteriaceae bacterium]|nr:copper chaperone PCu(A)C [Burkholderiaceae bacterium]